MGTTDRGLGVAACSEPMGEALRFKPDEAPLRFEPDEAPLPSPSVAASK
jgi:hypothetical protein